MSRPHRPRSRERQTTVSAQPGPRAVAPTDAWFGRAAHGAVAVSAFVLGFHKLDDFDTWWHLAAGRWVVAHGAIPATDTLSHTVPGHPWINLQWGFDVALYLLHEAGGPSLVSFVGALAFLATALLLLRLLAGRIGNTAAAFIVLIALLAAHERVTLRPELLSFVLLAAVLAVLDSGRRSNGRGLWLLVPLMLVWANTHALFVVGAFAIVCALIGSGSAPSRQFLRWGAAALAVVVVNPFGLRGAWFPVTLLSRIDGSHAVFQTVGEFGSPLSADATGVSIVFYKILLGLGGVAGLWALLASARATRGSAGAHAPRFDWASALLFLGLAVLSTTARRNIALFAVGATPFIARCLEAIYVSSPGLARRVTRLTPVIAATTAISAAVLSVTVVTGTFYKRQNAPQEFGAGVIEGTFPVRAAAFARAVALPPRLYNDMASGGYLAWDPPVGGGVFVDGRLEVYDTEFLTTYMTATSTPSLWAADADRYGVQTAIIFHRFETDRLLAGRLAEDQAWALVYADEVAAVFVRVQGNGDAIARAAALRDEWDGRTNAWLSRPMTTWGYPAGRIEGTRAYARFLATIGRADAAVAAYLTLLKLGIPASEEVERRMVLARYFMSRGQRSEAREQARGILAIDPHHAEARQWLQ